MADLLPLQSLIFCPRCGAEVQANLIIPTTGQVEMRLLTVTAVYQFPHVCSDYAAPSLAEYGVDES